MKQLIIQPVYTVKLPSTKKTVTFRPFTVKEEKALLLALQENNVETVAAALKATVFACTNGTVDPDTHPYYDMEFLFLHIRSKSVGEIVNLVGKCDCKEGAQTEFQVDVTTAKLEPEPTGNMKIKIPGTVYTISLRHPTLSNFIESFATLEDSTSGIETVASCIDMIYTDEEILETTLEEKIEFINSMTPLQQKDIVQFLDSMPMVKVDSSYTCKHCGLRHEHTLSGFENFFL
jgi:hypothetical protein